MSLPNINVSPFFPYTLPITKKVIKYRPYTVKEEKTLLIAIQSKDINTIVSAISTIIAACTGLSVKEVEKLPLFELEVLTILVRAVSVGEVIQLKHQDSDGVTIHDFTVNIKQVVDEATKDLIIPDKKIQLNDTYGVVMNDLTVELFTKYDLDKLEDPDEVYKVLGGLINNVYGLHNDELYKLADFTQEEITEFLDNFDHKSIEKLVGYLNSLPKLRHVISYKNKAGDDKEIVFEGLADFFQSA